MERSLSLRNPFFVSLALVVAGCKQVPAKVESGFDMSKNSMSFANFANGYDDALLDAESMQRMFGTKVCQNQSSPCELTLAATAFMAKANKSMLGGRCEGFAVLSTLLFDGKLDPTSFGGVSARDLTLEDNSKLQRELAYWFATQISPKVVENTKGYMAKDVMAVLAQGLAKGATERYRIGIVKKVGDKVSGGHALTPIAYYADKAEGVYIVRLYDNNIPGEERQMRIDTKKNRWEYEASENPGKKSSLYFGDDSNKNPLYLAPIFSRNGELPCHFCTGGKAQVTTSGGAQVVAEGASGATISPSFSALNDDDGASYTMFLPPGAFKFTINNGDDGLSTDRNSASIDVINADSTTSLTTQFDQESQWEVSADSRQQTFHNASNNPVTIHQSVMVNGSVVSVTAIVQGGSTTVSTEVKADGKIALNVNGAVGTPITLNVTITDANGMTTTGTVTYTSTGDSSLSTDATQLSSLGSLQATVSNNGMTQMLGDSCADNRKNGTESDVDCGGTCTAKCELNQACASGVDCTSTFCAATSKTCVASSCEDQTKSGDESDVDCGGSCNLCAATKACGTTLDCAAGLVCDAMVCKPSFVLKATVSGLHIGGNVTLTNATNGDTLTVTSDGTGSFPSRIVGPYNVSITSQPSNGLCTLISGSGTATTDTTLQVTCIRTYSVGGSVSGLSMGGSLVVRNNGGDSQTITGNGLYFFPTRVPGAYAVTVFTQPTMQTCSVANPSGTATNDVANVDITCTSGFTIGGSVAGLPATQTVVLQNNGGDNLSVTMNGAFTFSTAITGAYAVTILTQPAGATCAVTGGGTGMAAMNVTSVAVTCVPHGSLDTSYATGGFYTDQRTGGQEWFRGVVNPDDSVVWVGRHRAGAVSNEDWAISKMSPSGAPDGAFGSLGNLFLGRQASTVKQARAIARLTNGDYLVAGTSFAVGGLSREFSVARITAAGALDATFGTSGYVDVDSAANADDVLSDMAVRSDGSMILVGTTGAGTNADVFIVALTAAGAVDMAFGTSGRIVYGTAGVEDVATAVSISPMDDFVVVGRSGNDSLILSYTSLGGPFVPFGTGGALTIDLAAAGQADGLNTVLGVGGGAFVGGFANNGTDNDLVVALVDPFGALDPSFGTGGIVRLNRGADDVVNKIAPGPLGGVYLGGTSGTQMTVGLLQNNGLVSPNFGVMGFFESNFGVSFAACNDFLFDSTGRLLIGGHITTPASVANADFGVARLTR